MVSVKKVECAAMSLIVYRKIPKISPGAYIFQGAFLRGLFLEGLIFGGAYIRRGLSSEGNLRFKIDWALPFLLCFTLYLRHFSKYKPPGSLYLCYRFGGLIFGGAYT